MNIPTSQSYSKNNLSFRAIIIPNENVRTKILKGLDEKQLQTLKKDLLEQKNNPVNAIIDKGKLGLKAKIFCQYRLKDFVEDYKQIPFFESNRKFLNRIIKKCNEYKKQLNF